MKYKILIAAIVALAASACQHTESLTPEQVEARAITAKARAEADAIMQKVSAETDENGWRVTCAYDQHKDLKTCRMSKGSAAKFAFLTVLFVNGEGPGVAIFGHTFPGRDATIRVNSGPVLKVNDYQQVVEALSAEGTAYVVYHVWPEGERRMEIDLTGFNEAYKRLRSMLQPDY